MATYSSLKSIYKKNKTDVSPKSYEQLKKERKERSYYNIDEDYVNDFVTRSQDFYSRAQNDIGNPTYSNSKSNYDMYSTMSDALNTKANAIRSYYNANKSAMDSKSYDSMIKYLNSFKSNSGKIVDSFKNNADYFSSFGTENDYNNYLKQIEEEKRKNSIDTGAYANSIFYKERALEDLKKEKAKFEAENFGPLANSNLKPSEIESKTTFYNDRISSLESEIEHDKYDLENVKNTQKVYKWDNLYQTADDFAEVVAAEKKKNPNLIDNIRAKNDVDLTPKNFYQQRGMDFSPTGLKYDMYTENENDTVYYLNGKFGEEAAQEYVNLISNRLSNRAGQTIGNYLEGNTALELAFDVAASIDNVNESMKNTVRMFANDYASTEYTPMQYASMYVGQDLEERSPKAKAAYDAISTVTSMLYDIGIGAVSNVIVPGSGGIVTNAMFGGTAAGSEYQQKINEGMLPSQAKKLAIVQGVWETASEALLGSMEGFAANRLTSKLAGSKIANFVNKLGKKAGNASSKIIGDKLTRAAGGMVKGLLKMPIDAAQEGAEEVIQDIGASIIDGVITGEWEFSNFEDQTYNFTLGAISAAMLNSIASPAGRMSRNIQAGLAAKNNNDVERLKKTGSLFSADSVAYKLAGKVDENTNAYTLGRLFNSIDAELTQQNKADITNALVNKGMARSDAETISEWLGKAVEGEYFTEEQQQALISNEVISDVFIDVILNRNSTLNQRLAAFNGIEMEDSNENVTEKRNETVTNENVPVKNVETETAIPEYEEPASEEMTIDEAIANINKKNIDQATIEQIKNEYDGSMPAEEYVEAMLNGFDYGYVGIKTDNFKSNTSWDKLNDMQKSHSYRLGAAKKTADIEKRNAEIASGANGNTVRRRGTVKAQNVSLKELKTQFNDQQNLAYKTLDDISRVTGFDIVLFKSKADDNGKFTGAQGKFKKSENKIYIDVNAGLSNIKDVNDLGKYAMLRTFSHELTHTGEYWAPTEYDTLAKLVFETMEANGQSVNDLIEKQMADYNLDYDKASREVVAEAMTDILPQNTFAQKLAEENPNIFKKFIAKLKNFLDNIKKYFANLGHNTSAEPKALKEERDGQLQYIQSIVDAYDNMVIQASKNYQLNFAVKEKPARTTNKSVAETTVETVETPVVEETEETSETEYNPTESEKEAVSEAMEENMAAPESVFPTQIEETEAVRQKEEASTGSKTEQVETKTTVPETKGAAIAAKIIKGTTKKSGQKTFGIESNGYYLIGNGAVLAVVDQATYDNANVEGKAKMPELFETVNALTDKIMSPAYRSGEGIIAFNTTGHQVSLTQKYAKYFDGYDFYYNPKVKKAPLAIKDGDTLVGVILPVNSTNEIDFADAELVHFKSFDKYLAKEDKTNGKQVRKINEGTVSQSDTDRTGDTRLLAEVQEENVRGNVPAGEPVQSVEAGVGETGRNDNRTDAERNGSGGSNGSSEVGDLRRNDGLSPEEKSARDFAEKEGYEIRENPLSKQKGMKQIDIKTPDGLVGVINPIIINEESDWKKVNSAIELHEESQKKKSEQLKETVTQEVEEKSTVTPKGSNFIITDKLNLPDGEKARFRANVDAIKLVKQLESEGRYATSEEQETLSKYVGWGGLSNAFGENRWNRETRKDEMVPKSGWENEFKELKGLVDDGIITEQEYKDASASTKNAHYTSIEVIKGMYSGLSQLGFNGGRMLEPSSGTGNFVGAMPTDMSSKVNSWTMVELDSITGLIAKYLYPNADVRIQGFEKANIPDNYMDVAIGNVSFGNYGIVDKAYPNRIKKAIHNYFFAKSIDKVRPGGIVMFITSSFTMNGVDTAVRQYIMDRADLLGAIRLPNNAFKGNAGTEVVTDIIVLKKRKPGTEYSGEAFLESPSVKPNPDVYNYANINEYFVNHPEMVLGTAAFTRGMYGANSLTYNPLEGKGSLENQIAEAFKNIKGKMDYATKATPEKASFNAQRADKKTKNNGLVSKDGKIYKNDNGTLVEQEVNSADANKITDVLAIRDAYKQLVYYIQQGQAENLIKSARKDLNAKYDAFVKKNGYLNETKNKKLFEADPDHYSILSLENYDAKAKKATKADIFTKDTIKPNRTVTNVDSISDGVIVSLNTLGRIDAGYIAKLTGRTADDITRELIDTKTAFKTPKGELEAPETYLSGNVRAKLREVEGLAPLDSDYKNNVDELKKVLPKDIPYNDIYVTPGTPWIPTEVYADFIAEMLGGYNNPDSYRGPDVVVGRSVTTGDYTIQLNNAMLKNRFNNTQKWGTNRRTFLNIIQAMMSNSSLTVSDTIENADGKKTSVLNKVETEAVQEKAKEITAEFQRWLWDNESRRKELAALYNETFNALVNPRYSGKNLTINGLNATFDLRPHQADAVQRIISSGGNTLLAHRVGAGKTLEMASAAMKLRELGIVKKPMFAVPKSLVAQWGVEFKSYFPTARLLVADEKSFTKANRKLFTNQIANGDFDAIIVSYEQFEKVPMSAEYQQQFYQQQIDEIISAIAEEKAESKDGKGLTVKEMEKKRAQLEKKIQELTTKEKDEDNVDFEQLGIDSLFVDEAHNFKNLQYVTRMNNVAGLGNTNGSQRAFDLYTKIRYLQGLNGGRGIVFATATPVMNSMAEMYIMQKYLQSDMLNQLGLNTFDAWAKQFGEVTSSLEVKPSGQGYRKKETFANFKNLNELQLLFRSFSDVLTDVPGLKIPKMKGGQVQIVECEPGEFQKNYMKELEKRAENVKNVDASVDNMLKITSDGRKVSYTQRMIDPSLPYETGSKIFKCCDNVLSEYKASSKNKGTQIVFCDMATPKGKSKTADASTDIDDTELDTDSARLYDDMKAYLIKKGIPAKEIAFIHDAVTDQQRKQLFADVNDGKVRVLIGSTGKMGVGMNAQQRIVAIHHLDAPWRPGDVEQRDGRAFRQKNMNEEVSKYVYVTKGSFDARLWDILNRKQNFINQIMNGNDVGRTAEDTGDVTLSAAEVMAVASGNPLIKESVDLSNQIQTLESLQKAHNSAILTAREKIQRDTNNIATYTKFIENGNKDIKKRTNAYNDNSFSITVDGKNYTDKKEAGLALANAAETKTVKGEFVTLGSFAGFELQVMNTGSEMIGQYIGSQAYKFSVYTSNTTHMINQLCNNVGGLETKVDAWKAAMGEAKNDLAAQEQAVNKPFAKQAELDAKRARYNEVMAQLNPAEEQQTVSDDDVQYQARPVNEYSPLSASEYRRFEEMNWEMHRNNVANKFKIKDGYVFPINNKLVYNDGKGKIYKVVTIKAEEKRPIEDTNTDKVRGMILLYEQQTNRGIFEKNDYSWISKYCNRIFGFEVNIRTDIVSSRKMDRVVYRFGDESESSEGNGLDSSEELLRRRIIEEVSNAERINGIDTQNQERTSPLTDRELLSMAKDLISTSDFTEGEMTAFNVFNKRMDKLTDLETQRSELGRLYKEQQFGSNVDRQAAAETLNRMHILDDQIKKASNDVLDVEEKEVLKRVLSKARNIAEMQERERGKETLERWRAKRKENESIKKYKERVKNDVKDLTDWLIKPDNKAAKQIPDVLKKTIGDFLTSIDLTSDRKLRGGEATKADIQFNERLIKLRDAISNNATVTGLYSGYNDLPEGFMEELQRFIDMTGGYIRNQTGEFVINRMNAEELKSLAHIVKTVKRFVKQMNMFHENAVYQHVYEAGNNSYVTLKKMKKASTHTGDLSNFLFWENMRPAYAFERFGEGGKAIYDEFRRAQSKLAYNAKQIIDYANATYTTKEVTEWEKETKEVKLGEDTVKVPVSYLMSFYELSKQPDSLRHILGEGLRVATYKVGKEKLSDVGHELTKADVETLVGLLTDRQKQVADKLQNYMATVGADWGNYVSVKRFGEQKFTNPLYFPINSDGRHIDNNMEEAPSAASLYALLNMSFTKERNENANNRIVLYSIFDVFSNHMASMAQYNAFALPILDSLKWFNYKETVESEDGRRVVLGSLREELSRVYGVPEESRPGKGRTGYAENFITNIIKAYNGTETQGIPSDAVGLKLMRQYNMAQIAYNLRVVVQQPMAITRAGMLISYNSIRKATSLSPSTIKANIDEMNAHSGIAQWKSLGFYDTNISRGLTDTIKHKQNTLEKINEVGMTLAEKADQYTWAVMWRACKEEIDSQGKYEKGTDKYFDAVTALFEDVIYKTQVVDSVLTKTELMRSKGFFSRAMSSFMSEPSTTASMLLNAYDKYSTDINNGASRSEAWQKNKALIGKTAAVYSISAILLAAVQSVVDAMRDDDDEPYVEKYADSFIGNVIDELMPFNKLPFFSDFYDVAKEIASKFGVDTYGNPPQTIIMQWYDALMKGIDIMQLKINGSKTGYTWYAGIQKMLQTLSGMTGIPVNALTRELVTIWNNTVGAINNNLKVVKYRSTKK